MKSALGSFGVTGRQRHYIDDVFGSVDKDGIYLAGLLDVGLLDAGLLESPAGRV